MASITDIWRKASWMFVFRGGAQGRERRQRGVLSSGKSISTSLSPGRLMLGGESIGVNGRELGEVGRKASTSCSPPARGGRGIEVFGSVEGGVSE